MSRTGADVLDHVVSADGTRIAVTRLGQGPPVVVLPGAMNTGASWRGVADLLAADHTVWLVDRRNYPPSGTGPGSNTFEREADDVRAVIAAAGEAVHLVGHSYGGLLALHAARLDPTGISTLLLYEPPVLAGGPHVPDVLRRYRERLAAGDPMGAIGVFLQDLVRLPAGEFPVTPAGEPDTGPGGAAPPTYDELAALARAVVHDIEAIAADGDPDPGRFAGVAIPTLIMAGARSWAPVPAGVEALAAVLPDVETVRWADQSHFANMTDPVLVADVCRDFVIRRGGAATR